MDDIEVLEVEDSKMYQEYYGKILKYLDKTKEKDSLLIEFHFENNTCQSKIIRQEQNNPTPIIIFQSFTELEEVKKHIIIPLIKTYLGKYKVLINKIYPTAEKESMLKLMGGENTSLNIIGLEQNQLEEFYLLVKEEQEKRKKENGISNTIALGISLIVVGIILMLMAVPNLVK